MSAAIDIRDQNSGYATQKHRNRVSLNGTRGMGGCCKCVSGSHISRATEDEWGGGAPAGTEPPTEPGVPAGGERRMVLRHRDIQTTLRYAYVPDKTKRERL